MNYLQRFSRALATLRGRGNDSDRVGEARRLAGPDADEWFSQIHRIARSLPPRPEPRARGGPRRGTR